MVVHITSREVRALRGATSAQLKQVMHLIETGRAWVVGRDPALRQIGNALSALGVRSAQSRKFLREAQEREKIKTKQLATQRAAQEKVQDIQRQKLEKEAAQRGVIFLKRQELEKVGITESQKRALTLREQQATSAIREAERILKIKDSGAGFVPGEAAVPFADETTILEGIRKRTLELEKLEKQRETERTKEKIISLGADIKNIKSIAKKAEIFALGMGSAVISNVAGVKQIPKTAEALYKEIQEDPKNIIKIGKRIPDVLKQVKEESVDLYKVSPTSMLGVVAGEYLVFRGTGKVLKVIGKLGKIPAKAVKTALRGKKGTPVGLIGSQSASGNKIITKIIFTKGRRQIGGAIGTSIIRKGKVLTTTVGKVGKIGRITKKFREKAVFVGEEVSISKAQRFKLIKQLKVIKNARKLTIAEKRLFSKLRGKKKTIRITKDLDVISETIRIAKEKALKKIILRKRKITKQIKEKIIKASVRRKRAFLRKSEIARKKGIQRLEIERLKKRFTPETFGKMKRAFLRKSEIARKKGIRKLTIQKAKELAKKIKIKPKKKIKEIPPKKLRKIALVGVKRPVRIPVKIAKKIKAKRLREAEKRLRKRKKAFLRESEKVRKRGIRKLEIEKVKKRFTPKTFRKKKRAFLRESEKVRKRGIVKLEIERVKELVGKPREKFIEMNENLEGLLQVGAGTIAQAPRGKLLRTVAKFPTTQIKKLKAKGLTIKDFSSISRIFTRKDLSLITGKILTKKKDVIDFIGLIKATSGRTLDSFSGGKQQLFRNALKDVIGTATVSTQRGGKIIPKLSPKARNLIVSSTGIAIIKAKVVARPTIKVLAKQRQVLTQKTKQVVITQRKTTTKQIALTKRSQAITKKQGVLAKQKPKTKQAQKLLQKQKQGLKQKQKLLTKQKQTLKQKQKLLTKQRQGLKQRHKLITKRIKVPPPAIIPRVKIPVGIVKPKKKKRVVKKKIVKLKFSVEIRRFNKWKRIGSFNTQQQARSRGLKRAKRTLGASIRVKKDGKIVKLKTTKQFRRSKVDPRILVQKKIKIDRIGGRLGTKAEVAAMKKARQRARRLRRKPMKKSKRRTPSRSKRPARRKLKRRTIKTIRRPKQIKRRTRRRTIRRSPIRKMKRSPKMPLKLKKLSRTVIKKARKGKKPTRWRFKGNRRLGFRNNEVVEIVKFNLRKSSPKRTRTIKRKATPQQLRNLKKGRAIRMKNLRKR